MSILGHRDGKHWHAFFKGLMIANNVNINLSEQCRIADSKANQVLGIIWRNITHQELGPYTQRMSCELSIFKRFPCPVTYIYIGSWMTILLNIVKPPFYLSPYKLC